MRQAVERIPRAAYTLLIVIAACAGLLYDALLHTSQLLMIVPRSAAATSWPFDPAEATVAFYREMIDLHDEIINLLYPPNRDIDDDEDETSTSEARSVAAPIVLQEALTAKEVVAISEVAESPAHTVLEPTQDTVPAVHKRSGYDGRAEPTAVRSHNRAPHHARGHHNRDYGRAGRHRHNRLRVGREG
jgi:hypothetical protein